MNRKQEKMFEMLKEIEYVAKDNKLTYYLAYGTLLGVVRNKGFIPWDNDIDIIVKIDDYFDFIKILSENITKKYKVVSFDTDSDYDSLKARVAVQDIHHTFLHVDIFPMVGAPKKKYKKLLFDKIGYLIYRGYFFKKVNPKINYKNSVLKQLVVIIIKILLLPFPEKVFIDIFNKLSTRYPIKEATEMHGICSGDMEYIPKEWFENTEYMHFESEEFPVPKEWDKYLTYIYGDYMTPRKENYYVYNSSRKHK